MKEYFISKTGEEISISYSPSSTVSWSVSSESPSNWFTWSASNGVLTISCQAASGTDLKSIELAYTINGVQCNSIKVVQNGIDTPCNCENVTLNWSIPVSDLSEIPSEGATFYATYDNTQCVGGDLVFWKEYDEDWWTITHDATNRRLNVVWDDAMDRDTTSLYDELVYSVDGNTCEPIRLTQRSWCSHITKFETTLTSNIPQSGMSSGTTIGEWELDSSSYNNRVTVSSPDLQLTYANGNIVLDEAIAANTKLTTKTYTINIYMSGGSRSCSSFTIVQDGTSLPSCGCDTLKLLDVDSGSPKSPDYHYYNPIPYAGGEFKYEIGFAMCEGQSGVTFAKVDPRQDYFSYTYSTGGRKNILTVTVEEAGSRSGRLLEGAIYVYVNSELCKTIIFKQNPTPCDCDDLTIRLQS